MLKILLITYLAAAQMLFLAPNASARSRSIRSGPFSGSLNHISHTNAPTADLNAVADALEIHAKSLSTMISAAPGLTLARPVTVSAAYLSRFPGNNERVTQIYSKASGARLMYFDPEGDGKPRDLHLDITLSQANPSGGIYSFNVSLNLRLDPLYDVGISPFRFTLLETCNLVGATEINFYWYSPDSKRHMDHFIARGGHSFLLDDASWSRVEVSASDNLKIPAHYFRTVNTVDWHDTGAGFEPPPGPSNTNLVPGKTHNVDGGLERAINEDTCEATIKYGFGYTLDAYFGGPHVRDHRRR